MNGTTQAVSGVTLWLSSADQKKLRKVEFERVALPQLSHLYTSAAYLTKDKAKAEDLVLLVSHYLVFQLLWKSFQATNPND